MLTDLSIKKQPLPEKRRELADGKITGLYLVLQPSGAKSWALRYRAAGKPAKLTLGPYPTLDLATARRRAREALGEIASGKNPAADKKVAREAQRAANSTADRVEAVANSFIERYVKRNVGASWARETERLLRVEVIPEIGGKRIGEVSRADIHKLLDEMVDRGSPINANRLLAVLRRMFNWCIERGLVERSPCDKLKAPSPEQARDRVLSDSELRVAWQAFERIGWPFGRIAQLLLLTGARRDEIAGARWSEIDLEAKTWTIAKERSKNGVAHEIPLSDAAIQIIKSLPRIGGRATASFSRRRRGRRSRAGRVRKRTSTRRSSQSYTLAPRLLTGPSTIFAAPPPAVWPAWASPRMLSRPCSTIRAERSKAWRPSITDTATRPKKAPPWTRGRGGLRRSSQAPRRRTSSS